MPDKEPKIIDLNYNQLVQAAQARISVHNPEWTNFNDSDPGITLIHLFAFMAESLIYRSNLIPDRNRKKFLKLLGVPIQPAETSNGIITFSSTKGSLKTINLLCDLEVSAGNVPFRTLDGLDVLPVEAYFYYKSPIPEEKKDEAKKLYSELYTSFQEDGTELGYYETKSLDPPTSGSTFPVVDLTPGKDTVDGSLWVALLAASSNVVGQIREAIANRVLTMGVLPAISDADRVLLPGGPVSAESQPNLIFQIPIGGKLPSDPQERKARYQTLDVRPSGDLLSEPGVVQLPLPGSQELQIWENFEPLEPGVGVFPPLLEDEAVQDRVITWIRISLPNEKAVPSLPSKLSARISWIGINATRVKQRAHVFSENLAKGTGEPDQVVTLANKPIIRGSVKLMVEGELWHEIDDLMAAHPEVPVRSPREKPSTSIVEICSEKVKVFKVDRESGQIFFGDGMRGARPALGATIRANYDYGGGRKGNIGIGAINKNSSVPAGMKVTNPIPTWGGDDGESVIEAEHRAALYLQHRERLVSKKDFEDITQRTPGVDIGRVEVLPLFHPDQEDVEAEGIVTVMVIPRYDPISPEAPFPDRLFLQTVCEYLYPRRIVTTEIHVRGPVYEPIWSSVGIEVIPGRDLATIWEAAKKKLRNFLSPLTGGFDQMGWPLKQSVDALELMAVVARVEGVSKVNKVLLAHKSGSPTAQIPMLGLQLPFLMGLAVQSGEPQEIEELRGDTGAALPEGLPPRMVPVPIIPLECK